MMDKKTKIILYTSSGIALTGITTLIILRLLGVKNKDDFLTLINNLDLTVKGLTPDILNLFIYYSDLYGIPVQIPLAMAEVESGFDPHRYNPEYDKKRKKYVTYNKLVTDLIYRDPQIAEFYYNSPDRGDKTKWGSYGYFQIVPHYSLNYGDDKKLKIGESNSVLFNPERQIPIAIHRMARLWHIYKNAADIRAKWARNYTVKQAIEILETGPSDKRFYNARTVIAKSVGRFLKALKKYEKKYGRVKHFENEQVAKRYLELCNMYCSQLKSCNYCVV